MGKGRVFKREGGSEKRNGTLTKREEKRGMGEWVDRLDRKKPLVGRKILEERISSFPAPNSTTDNATLQDPDISSLF